MFLWYRGKVEILTTFRAPLGVQAYLCPSGLVGLRALDGAGVGGASLVLERKFNWRPSFPAGCELSVSRFPVYLGLSIELLSIGSKTGSDITVICS